jgi:YegS/Rv2252/BmrU family lipid kinase
MKLLFIINPTSGRTSNERAIESIKALGTRDSVEVKFLYTTGKGDDEAIREEFSRFIPNRVIACGGDGTVQLVARNLIGKDIPMGILPLGSANGLAKALDLPQNVEAALERIVTTSTIIPLDLLKINDKHVCIHLSDIGTNALLVKSYEESGDKGMLGYAKHLISSIQQSDLMRYTIVTPEETYHKDGYMLAIANAHKYGTGVHISEGSVSDGRFEICNVQKIDLESAIKAGLTALNVFVDKDMFSDVITCKEARIRIDRKAHLQIDGEYMGEFDELKAEIIESAVAVLI